MKDSKIKIIFLCGPTGVGKTALSCELAALFKGEIIVADSQAVLKGFDIGTAKATLEERQEIPHHLFDVVEFGESFNAAQFAELADQAILEIISRGKNVFISGGTGLYFKALLHGFMEAPSSDLKFRQNLEKRIQKEGLTALYAELAHSDPQRAREIHPNDTHRIMRALEIYHLSGLKPSELAQNHQFQENKYEALKIGLHLPRDELYRRINQRVLSMLNHGWVEEVKSLLEKGYDLIHGKTQTIGYPWLAQYVQGEIFLKEAIEEIQKETRNLAKRQIAWFKRDPAIHWFRPHQKEEITRFIRLHLET